MGDVMVGAKVDDQDDSVDGRMGVSHRAARNEGQPTLYCVLLFYLKQSFTFEPQGYHLVHLSLEVGREGLAASCWPNETALPHTAFDVVPDTVASVVALVRRRWESGRAAKWA